MLANLGYDGEHVWLENLAAIIGRRRRKKRGTGDDAVETSLVADILARVLRVVCNGGDTTDFELGQVFALVYACPAEEREPLFVQTLALFGRTRGTPQNEAKASLVGEREREDWPDSKGFKGRCPALGSAGVRRRCPIGERTTSDYCGYLGSDGA